MPTNMVHTVVGSRGTERPVPLWAERVAHLIPLVGLPVCLWRLPIGFGYAMGGDNTPSAWWHIPYVFGLSLLTEAFALLGFGLVRRWGEVVPNWVPKLGGRRIPPFAAIVPATIGGLLLLGLMVNWIFTAFRIDGSPGFPYAPGWDTLAMTVSGLLTLWGPLMLALTYGYYRRRCRPDA
ncbi:hypothetical protein D9753_03825 [Streptomyces dangxiongensis]|uniref:Uncharacterized protein n=1 Tax=Streptomyces dangxiongensis TaxID=1442032 RepID=A0A3G2J960_9ACTN|nr:hypothetical protein [Streptomyces dangxiongensis]AYN38211.1 hypothetical protein D9753_03825 [Streptomyces dangxiongensis]